MNILAIGAHPDDIEYGCGGSLAKHGKQGDHVCAIVLTKGEKGGNPTTRVHESEKALSTFNVGEIHFGDFKDTELYNYIPSLIVFIEDFVNRLSPDRVYTNTQNDRHQDHIATFIATKAACRSVHQVLAYETPSSDYNFKPQAFIDIKDYIDIKIEAVLKHKTQNEKEYMKVEAIKGLSMFRGQQLLNYSPVEAFEVIRYKILS